MSHKPHKPQNLPESLRRELLAAERLESGLTALLSRLEPPYGAIERLLAKIQPSFHEHDLMLDGGYDQPINFQQAIAAMQADQDTDDLLAAGLEEEPLDESIEEETD
ncbi:MAG: hypothetical protein AAGC44_11625 [Planctomycetota bacterium]